MPSVTWLILFFLSNNWSKQEKWSQVFSLTQKHEQFQVDESTKKIRLNSVPIIQKTEQILLDDQLLIRNQDYRIDYEEGLVEFDLNLVNRQQVTIIYQTLPFPVLPIYKRDFLSAPSTTTSSPELNQSNVLESIDPLKVEPQTAVNEQPTLQVAGSQTFGVSVGTGQSLSQNQELRVNIFGNISEDIEVIAMLSDQDLPIQPEGTTENIQDFDQKLIRITSPTINGTLGDLTADIGNTEIQFPMALEGVFVEGNFRYGSFRLIPSAVPKGLSTSKTIQGQEGRSQYRLDVDGQFVVAKADSEIVWLNGEKMKRGRTNDYVIRDYGDPIIEFTNRHIITNNDLIRVDFEHIPEDLVYQRSIRGFRGLFHTADKTATIGFSYANETDHDNPDDTFVLLSAQDLRDLRQNQHDSRSLIAPHQHTVWGIETQLGLAGLATLNGQMAFSTTDTNTLSSQDARLHGRSWKLHSTTQYPTSEKPKLVFNLTYHDLTSNYRPVGSSDQSRNRYQYSSQYKNHNFDDQYLGARQSTTNSQIVQKVVGTDERQLSAKLQLLPFTWMNLTGGLGKTKTKQTNTEFHNFALDLVPKSLPHLHLSQYNSQNSSKLSANASTNNQKYRQQGNLSYRKLLTKDTELRLHSGIEQLFSKPTINSTEPPMSPQKRQINRLQVDLQYQKLVTLDYKYAQERSKTRQTLLTVDNRPLMLSDWLKTSQAQTWSIGNFSQVRRWVNFSSNLSRRRFRNYGRTDSTVPPDTTTQLADINCRVTPLNGAINFQFAYELDKKLATKRREVYTDINPYSGHQIRPGEGHYVKIDELHYVEDYEKGQFIKIIQNLADKPVTAIDTKVQLRVRPRSSRPQFSSKTLNRKDPSSLGNSSSQELIESKKWWTILLKWVSFSMRHSLTEEQEDADQLAFYLLQQRLSQRTVYGRHNQRYQITVSPSPKFTLDFNYVENRSLNRRVNNRQRQHQGRNWNLRTTINPTVRLSLNWQSEWRYDLELFDRIGQLNSSLEQLSNLDQFEQRNELDLRYELNQKFRINWVGIHQQTKDTDSVTNDATAYTQTLSLEKRLTYSMIGKGRLDMSYQLAYGKNRGGQPFIRYNFYSGFSHQAKFTANYRIEKYTDLQLRFNYRLLATEVQKPEHRAEMEVRAQL